MATKSKAEPVSMIIRGRLAFVNVFKPRPSMQPGGDPKYSVCIMIPKKDPQCKTIKAAVDKLANDEWGPGAAKKLGTPSLKTIFRDGAENEEKYPEFHGHMFLNASSKTKPGVVDFDRNPIYTAEDCYSGVDAQVQVNLFTYEQVSKGVSAGLNNVRVIQKLEAFTSREKAEEVAWDKDGKIEKPDGGEGEGGAGGDEMLS
jgi:hypothetical protein